MSETQRAIGGAIRGERTRLGLTQAELGAAIALSQESVSAIERGARPIVVETLIAVCRATDVTLRDLLRGLPADDLRILGLETSANEHPSD